MKSMILLYIKINLTEGDTLRKGVYPPICKLLQSIELRYKQYSKFH